MIQLIKKRIHNLVSDQKFSEILSGSIWALSARVASTLLGLVFSVIVARLYGAETVGILAVINSFLMLATIVTVLGTNTSILRLIPEHVTKYSPSSAFKVYKKTQYLVIGSSLVTGTALFFSADIIAEKLFSKPHLSFYLSLASVFIIFESMMKLNTEATRGLKLIKSFSLLVILPQTFNLLFVICLGLLWSSKNIPVYSLLGGFAMTGMLGWILMDYNFKKRLHPTDKIHFMSVRSILSISMPMLLSSSMALIISQTGVIILSIFYNEKDVGYYDIAVKLSNLTVFVLTAINSMAGPKFSELFHSDKIDELFHVAKKSAKLIFAATTPILICFLFFGKPILIIAFGKEFAAAYPALVLLALGQFVNSISGSSGMFLNMTGKQHVFRNIMILAAAINICLNLILIPRMGIIGAAISAMVSLCFWNIATLVYIKINFGKTTGYFPFIAS